MPDPVSYPMSDPWAWVQPGGVGPPPPEDDSQLCPITVGIPDVLMVRCTREDGHPGQHIAMSSDGTVAATWDEHVLSLDLSEATTVDAPASS